MITDISNVNNNWIYQSNKLIEASYLFTVTEQKLIRLLASMIKKDDESLKEYQFKATDLSKTLNIHKRNIYRELDSVTDKLMARFIKMKNDDTQEFDKFHLIKTAKLRNGILSLKIDEDMKDFYLKLNWYTKYQLKNIMQFKSTYSFRMYELLKQYENIRYRVITIEELRLALDIDKKQYPNYSNLKQKAINVAVNEINTNTDLNIEFEETKTGRKITSIKFYINQNNKAIDETAIVPKEIETDPRQDLKLIKQVQAILKEDITDFQAKKILDTAKGDINIIKKKYEIAETSDIKNIVGWMLKAIEEDYRVPKGNIKTDSFNDYPQREYDFPDLEKKLLGWGNRTDEATEEDSQQLSVNR